MSGSGSGPDEAMISSATVEVSPASISVVRTLADRLLADGGVALIIDYGHASSKPSYTLQAVQEHAYVPVLETPGKADLTAHVDFAELAACHGVEHVKPSSWEEFEAVMSELPALSVRIVELTTDRKQDVSMRADLLAQAGSTT